MAGRVDFECEVAVQRKKRVVTLAGSGARAGVVALVVAGLLTACSSVQVNMDYDPTEDFSTYKTFAWLPKSSEPTGDYRIDNELLDARIRAAVDRNLQEKGYVKGSPGNVDFYLAYHLSIESKLDVYTVNRGYYDYWGYGMGWPETRVSEYDEGSLVIDIAHAGNKELVWRGVAIGRVGKTSTPEKSTKEVNTVVAEILKRFPPEKKEGS
jgi:hypothetical protein